MSGPVEILRLMLHFTITLHQPKGLQWPVRGLESKFEPLVSE